ncbi:MAG: choice-of-anchor D domain-containing protein [Burkholderiales bacterium]|nr:choice-of-anchor D domain-containing protein [Burkholderiales bacterium]
MIYTYQNGRSSSDDETSSVEITVCDWHGRLVESPACVNLVADGVTYTLMREGATAVYSGNVPVDSYDLEVSSQEYVSPPRKLSVGPSPARSAVYVGERDWPFYRLGENAIPFPPPGPLLAVAFPENKPDPHEAEELLGQILKELPLEPAMPNTSKDKKGDSDGFIQAEGAIWIFRCTCKDTPQMRAELYQKILEITGNRGRVGVPTDLYEGQCKVIDNRFVLRFRDEIDGDEIERYVTEAKGTVLRGFRQARNTRLVALPLGDFARHLEIVEGWHTAGLLVYGEPDIMAEITDDAFPDDPPNDPTFASQANLTLQNVDLAWRMLNVADPLRTLGDPNVVVASLDRGLDTDHPDVGSNLTDGSAQVLRCYDFSGLRECTVPGYTPDTDHGMGVYGIIAALTNNGEDVSGIAPNTRQIVMERPSLTSANYPDVLLWAAGFNTGNASAGWPAEPLSDGADIISCSHGSNGLALSGIMDDTFQDLANNGRGGLGTVVVYSAGNDLVAPITGNLITGFRTWAAHPDTIAVANSTQPDGSGVETKVASSNFGPEIDICAQGAGAPSLDASGGEQTFGGTSAAAPTVAAAAALMLSANPVLRREEVRDILRGTAVKIDPNNTNATGRWRDANGLISSSPGYAGPNFSQFYGFGRLDVAAAVATAGWRLSLIIADDGDYGNVCITTFRDMVLTLNNSGVNTISITGMLSSSGDFVVPNVLSYPLTIEPGNALRVPIRFQPSSFGPKQATITVESAPFESRTIDVSGISRAPELDLIIVNGGTFGDACVGSGVDKTLTLLNSGPCPLTVTNISSSSGEFLVASAQNFPIQIAPRTAIQVPIRFAPTSFGPKSGVITVTSNDPTGPKNVSVSGKAPSGKLVVTGSTCIGGVKGGCLGERTISICNVGDCKLNVTDVALKRNSKYWKLINNPFPATLHPGSCLNVLIRYKAAEKCPRPSELIIVSDDPDSPEKLLDLMAYTSWTSSKCKTCCDTCGDEPWGKCHDSACSVQSLDACCDDEGEYLDG